MANLPDLRPGERSAEAERIAVLRSASPVRLAALAAFAAAVFMAVVQLGSPAREDGAPAFLTEALGSSDSSAPLLRRPAPGVELGIDASSFHLRSGKTSVTLETQSGSAGDWHRFENGVSRKTPVGVETIVVDGPALEQFLTVKERQAIRTWRWRIDTARTPRIGDDGGVAFLDTKLHKLTDVSIAPVAILDAHGRDVTPAGLRWRLERRSGSWWLTLRLDDSKLPLPYVIDPAVAQRNTQTGTASATTSVTVTKPTGVQANDLLVAHVMVTGNATASLTASGWTAITSATAANAATQASYYKIAGGSEPASYSFSWTSNRSAVASVTAYYGVKSSSALDVFSTIVSTNNTTTVTANGVTTTANDDIVLAFFGSVSNSTYTPPGSWNERADVGIAGISGSTADTIKTTAGATGNVSATSTVSARVYGHQAAFFVDDVAPSVTMSDPGSPVTSTITLQTSAASDTDSYVGQVQFERSPAGTGSWTNVGSADTTSPYSVAFDTTGVTDGLYDFRAVATDGAGNTANSATISDRRIDNTAPSSTTTFPASAGSYNASGWNAGCGANGLCGTYSDAGSGVQKVEISIRRNTGNYWNGSSFASASEVWLTTSLSGGNWSYTFPAGSFPADDTYTIRVRATDNVNIAETPSSRSFTYDTAAPNTSITANPADPTTSTSATFSFTSTEGGSTFECQLDGGGYASCSSPKSYTGPLSDGGHTVDVRATDPAGNTDGTPASYTWTVDTTAPSSTTSFPASGGSYNTAGWNAGCATNGFCGTYSDGASGSGVQAVEVSIRQGTGNYWSAGSFSSGSEVWLTTSLSAGNWAYTFPASSFPADGSYTIRVRATDNVGLVETPSSRSFTIDRAAPDTSITANPSDPSSSANASFSFTSTEGGSTFECRIDGGGYSSCSSPKSYSSLAEGSHTVLVRATDAAGNTDGSAASFTWTVDTVAPSSTTVFPASGGAYNTAGWNAGCATIGLCGTYSDATSGVQAVEVSIRQGAGNYWDGSSFGSASEVWNATSLSGGDWSYAFAPASFPADGSYTIRVRATDNATNAESPSSRSFTFDATDPSALFSFPASSGNYADAAWNAGCATNGFCGTYSDATSGVQAVEISIQRVSSGLYWNGSSFASGSEAFQTASLSAGNWSYSFGASSFPADGQYAVHVRAKDYALNTEAGPSRTLRIDNVVPSALFTFPASGGSYNASGWNAGCGTNGFCGTYTDSGSGVQSVEISVRQGAGNYWNGSSFGSGSEVFQAATIGGGNWSYAFPASSFPADGSYTVHIRGQDNASNTESGPSRSFTFDTAVPNTTVDSNPADPSGSADGSFTFSSTEGGSTFECELDGAGFSSCSSPKSYSGLSEGSHTFAVRATDAAGNTDASRAQFTWTVDTVAPSSTTGFPASGSAYNGSGWNAGCATAGFCGTYSDATSGVQTVEISIRQGAGNYWDGSSFGSASEAWNTTTLSAGDWSFAFAAGSFPADGPYTIRVRALDNAGNAEAPASRSFTIDTGPPSSTTSFPAAASFYRTSTWNAGCATSGFCGAYSDATTGVQKVEISIRRVGTGLYWNGSAFSSGSESFSAASLSAGEWSYAFAAAGFPADDDYTVRVKATDNADNAEAPSSRTFTFDATGPTGSLTGPADGALVSGSSVTVSSDSADAGSGVGLVTFARRPAGGGSWTTISTDATSPYAVAWDTTGAADGGYDLRVTTEDRAGNSTTSATRAVTVDNTAPTSATLDALPAAIRDGQSLAGSGADAGSGVDSLSYFYCAGPPCSPSTLIGSSTTGPSYSVTWSSQPADGVYQVLARVADRAGNTLDSTKQTVTIDNTDPTGSLTAPADGAQVSGTVTVSSDSTDSGSGVANAAFQWRPSSGGVWTTIQSDANAPYSVDWDTTPLSDGDYDLRVFTTDAAGNSSASATRTVTVDNHAPSVSITAPGAYVNAAAADPFTVAATSPDPDIASVEFFVCSNASTNCTAGSWSSLGAPDTTAPYTGSWNVQGDGNQALRAVITDNAFNNGVDVINTTVDRTDPAGSLTAPADGAFLSGSVSVSSDSADSGAGVASVLFERRPAGGGTWVAIDSDTTAPYSVSWDTSALSGDFDLHVVTTDVAGNTHTSSTRTVTVDNTAPTAPVVTLSESSAFAFASGATIFVNTAQVGTYDVAATSVDGQSGIEKIRFPGPVDDFASPYGASYAFGDLSGSQTVTAFSGAGLTASDTFSVTPDTTGPAAFSLTAPAGGTRVTNGQTVSASPVDAGAGIDRVEFRYCAGSGCSFASGTTIGAPDSSAPYSVTWNGQPADGTYTLVARATDNVGNSTDSAERTVTVDHTGPSSVLSVNEGTRPDLQYFDAATDTYYYNPAADGDFTLEETATDPGGVQSVDFPGIADTGFTGAAKSDTSSPYDSDTYSFTTASASAPVGQTVVVTDALGNATNDGFAIVRDVTAPAGGSVSYTDGYDADGSIVVSTADGTDGGAGLDASSDVLERRTSTLSNGSCAGFAGGWTAVTSPDAVASGLCAQYRYRVSDRVGNEAAYTSTDVVKVDTSAPAAPVLTLSESGAFAFVSGTTIYLNPAQSGTYDVDATTTDAQSGIDQVSFPGGQDDTSSPYQASYAFGDLSGPQTVTARSGAGLASQSSFTVTADTAAPTDGSVSYADGYDADGSVTIATADSTDALSGVDASSGVIERRTSALTDDSCASFAGGWSAVTSPDTVADGNCAQYRYRVSDNVGNEVVHTSVSVVKVDLTAPDTSIDVAPPDPDSSASPSFQFSASEPGASFECELDGGGFSSCASPKSYAGLADGSHTFAVRATDPAGNTDATPASQTWIVNAGAPSVSITAPSGFVNLADADPFTVAATSPDGDIAGVEFFSCSDASTGCSSGTWVSLGAPDTTAPYTASWPLPTDGNAALRAVATDVGSNTGEDIVNATVDRTRPASTIDSGPTDPTDATGATFDFSANESGATFECELDGGGFGACSSPESYSSLADGLHTFEVQATDPAGNLEATPQSFTWTVDTTGPDTSITANPSDPSASSSADFSFTSTEGGSSFECRLDGGSFAPCTSPASYSGLADGSHTFRVRATDAAGNADATPAVFTWTVDATAPGGGLTDPGSPLRGTVSLSASPSDTGVGVQDVQFQVSPANAGAWSTFAADTTAPYTASWDTTADVDGLFDLRIVVTDNALNSFASPAIEDRLVDNTAPSAVMDDPGANLSGTVGLTSTTGDTGSGVASVTYQRSPAGANTWTATPANWNTALVADGLYDLRVVATDNAGNSTTSAAVVDRRVDNNAPALSSSVPADGSKVAAAASLAVTASEDLADVASAEIDGTPVSGTVAGSTVTFTQAFADGPHMLKGELEDLAGNLTPIRIHFTVWSASGGDYPYIEKNSYAASAMTVAATNGDGQVTVPAGAWSGAPAGDWLVLRVDPRPAGPVSAGFQAVGDIYDVSAYWALSEADVTAFDDPIDLTMTDGAGAIVPAVLDGGSWRPASQLAGTTLPAGSQDGFYKVGDTVHLLTRATGSFTLLRDDVAPTKPGGFKGSNKAGRLVLEWNASTDQSGQIGAYLVYANGALAQTLGPNARSADMGAFSQKDARSFQVAARDAAGNVSAKTGMIVVVPKVSKLTVTQAKTTLKKRGLKAGKLTYVFSSVPKGRVVAATKTGLVVKGSAVPLKVSKGRRPANRPVTGTRNDSGGTTTFYSSGSPPPFSPPPTTAPPVIPEASDPAPAEPDGAAAAGGGAQPQSYETAGVSSARRLAGLALLGTLFLGAAAMVVRARRRLVAPLEAVADADEPILFWDERLARAAVSGFRRLFGH